MEMKHLLALILLAVPVMASAQAVGLTPVRQTFNIVAETTMTAKTFVQIDAASGTLEISDPSDDKPCVGMIIGAVNAGASVTVYRWGLTTDNTGLPMGQRIYAGRNGKPTWGNASAAKPEADDDASANILLRDDWVQEVGFSTDGTDLWFDCRQPALRRAG